MSDSAFKYGGLLLLTLQQASMPLMARYTRYQTEDKVFLTTVNVFMMEIIKLVVCSAIIIYNTRSLVKFFEELKAAIYDNMTETAKICLPALIYTLQNNLYYIALSHLEATTFCIAYQMKIFTTALLMYVVLGKRLSYKQWIALTLLVIGVIDVQLVYSPPTANNDVIQKPLLGFISVITMCFTSAFAGVYLEKVLKQSEVSVWMQNIRLAVLGLPISFLSMWFYDWETIQSQGMFRGWDFLVVCLTVTNSVGGLLISIVIKYADNILKAYAQSMAIIGAAVGSWLLFDFVPGFFFTLGSGLVIISIIMYTLYPYKAQMTPFEFSKLGSTTKSGLLMKTTSNSSMSTREQDSSQHDTGSRSQKAVSFFRN